MQPGRSAFWLLAVSLLHLALAGAGAAAPRAHLSPQFGERDADVSEPVLARSNVAPGVVGLDSRGPEPSGTTGEAGARAPRRVAVDLSQVTRGSVRPTQVPPAPAKAEQLTYHALAPPLPTHSSQR